MCTGRLSHLQTVQTHTHRKTGTDQLLGEFCAEGVQYVGALRGSVEQVADGDGTARRRHIQHCGAWEDDRDDTELGFFFIPVKSTVAAESNVSGPYKSTITALHEK